MIPKAAALGVCLLGLTGSALADNARTLPAGIWKTGGRFINMSSGPIDHSGSIVLPADDLRAAGMGALADALSDSNGGGVGDVDLEIDFGATVVAPDLFYGINDWLTVGAVLPIFTDAHVNVRKMDFRSGFWAYNSEFGADRSASPIVPAFDARAVTGPDAVQRAVTEGLQYKPIQNWQDSGVGDLLLVAQARLWRSEKAQLAAQPMITLPTGKTDDPDNLVDFGLGDGQSDVGGSLLLDYELSPDAMLHIKAGYTAQLAARKEMRAFKDEAFPLASKTQLPDPYADFVGMSQVVEHDPGDLFRIKPSMSFRMNKLMALEGAYELMVHGVDTFDGVDTSPLSVGTNYMAHEFTAGASINLVDSFLEGGSPVPLIGEIMVSQSLSSEDTANRRTVMMSLSVFFGSPDSIRSKSEEDDADLGWYDGKSDDKSDGDEDGDEDEDEDEDQGSDEDEDDLGW